MAKQHKDVAVVKQPIDYAIPPPEGDYVQRTPAGFIVWVSFPYGFTRCPGCGDLIRPGVLDKHHIVPLSKGGVHSIGNRQLICANCHRKIHRGL